MPSFPTDNFGSQLRGKSNLPDANYCVLLFKFLPKGHRDSHKEIGSLSPAEHLAMFELTTLSLEFLIHKLC